MKLDLIDPGLAPKVSECSLLDDNGTPIWRYLDTGWQFGVSDEMLLRMVAHAQIGSGYGNVAELMKRFAAAKDI